MNVEESANDRLKAALYDVIFGYETRSGRLFDIVLIGAIVVSVGAVIADSVSSYHNNYGNILLAMEWFFTILFTIEYALRIYSSPHPRGYVTSFYGIIDLLSILPTYIAFLFPGTAYLVVIRIMRVMRIFRILKLFRYVGEANILFSALVQARRKIFVFLFCVVMLIVIFGTLMFIIEGPENGFNSIPRSMYWAIVTVTTVGYGDIYPSTGLGQFVAALAMICGYAIIAVPTGIIGAELMHEFQRRESVTTVSSTTCTNCGHTRHDEDAKYCKHCGTEL
ncbi:MAG: ion transporter [Gammaproteobacteria bacterium]|nr:ion transporter [Gammaproteobacteria bacterium]